MKPAAALGVLSLALALLAIVPSPAYSAANSSATSPSAASPAGGSPAGGPAPAKNEGCAGETYRVSMVSHAFNMTREHAPGNRSPTGFLRITNFDLTVRGTFVSELRDGKLKWVSRVVDWSGQSSDNVPECHSVSCDAGGHLELDPSDGSERAMTNDQEAQMKWHCKPLKLTGNCFGYFPFTPASVPFPEIRATHDKLRSGCCYSSVDRDGTRYSETVEQRGNEQVSISADPTEIVPNQSGNNPDEATSQLTVKVTCDGVPLKDRQVGLRIDVKPRSGYHNHTDKRPRGQFAVIGKKDTSCGVETGAPEGSDDKSCVTVKTGASGEAKVKFKSPLTGSITWAKYGKYYSGIAGDYKITAKDEQLTEVRGDTIVVAEVKDLQPASFDSNLVQGRADISDSSSHPDGSWGTPGTLSAFSNLANDFFKYQDLHNTALLGCGKQPWKSINYPNKNVEPLSMNDIALPTGGVFDWHQTWRPSHQTHNKGEGGDFNRFAAAVEKNWEKKGTDCHGDTNVLLEWYMQVLLDLGKKYGSWDCADLGASGAYPVFSPDACAKGELPDVGTVTTPLVTPGYEGPAAPPFIYFPPLLHLHVYRRLGGDG